MYSAHREKKAIVTCEICGKSFTVRAHFEKHLESHTDRSERLAHRKQCEHCGEWLMTKSGMYYHEQVGVKNFSIHFGLFMPSFSDMLRFFLVQTKKKLDP